MATQLPFITPERKIMTNKIGYLLLAVALTGFAQEHKWAGRTLNDVEWNIHEKLAAVSSHGVFDTVCFEVRDDAIVLTGQVVTEKAKGAAERAVREVNGVRRIDNWIEVLPSSRKDDVLRMNVYKAIYESDSLGKYADRQGPSVHIIVKGGWVTLEGVVDSEDDRHMARLQALKVTSHVMDNLRVAPEAL
jgi:hyperosmotically inducible periplasmic protein